MYISNRFDKETVIRIKYILRVQSVLRTSVIIHVSICIPVIILVYVCTGLKYLDARAADDVGRRVYGVYVRSCAKHSIALHFKQTFVQSGGSTFYMTSNIKFPGPLPPPQHPPELFFNTIIGRKSKHLYNGLYYDPFTTKAYHLFIL